MRLVHRMLFKYNNITRLHIIALFLHIFLNTRLYRISLIILLTVFIQKKL